MKTNESNYVFEAENIIYDLKRTDKLLNLLFEELNDAHEATLDKDPHFAAFWVSSRKDTMEAILYSVCENVSKVCGVLQTWVNDSFERGE